MRRLLVGVLCVALGATGGFIQAQAAPHVAGGFDDTVLEHGVVLTVDANDHVAQALDTAKAPPALVEKTRADV
jgi:hypothetical protein